MPIATGVMLLTNVGLAIFNNWRGANNSKELQQKQREFQKAAQERNHERMKQLLREGQELNRKIEEELHQNRLENIERDFDSLINRIFAADDINTWPLKVLPMVMKNESLGSAFAHQEESVALHCILTPSNNSDFNKFVFPQLEREVEAFCNSNLTSLSSHPVIFYGGAWKSGTAPKGHEIDQLVADLPNLPMLLITPFFKPNNGGLTFHITTWGMCERQFMEIVPTTQFDYDYTEALEYTDDVVLNSVEQFSAYLESLIGYFADVYFWSAYNQVPITPLMIEGEIIRTDGMLSLVKENKDRYISLINSCDSGDRVDFDTNNKTLPLLSGAQPLFDVKSWNQVLNNKILYYYNARSGKSAQTLPKQIQTGEFNAADIDFLGGCLMASPNNELRHWLSTAIDSIPKNTDTENRTNPQNESKRDDSLSIDTEILLSDDITYLQKKAQSGCASALYRLGELYEYSIGPVKAYNKSLAEEYYNQSANKEYILSKVYSILTEDSPSNDSILYIHEHLDELASLSERKIPIAVIRLSQLYYFGVGVTKNVSKAVEIMEAIDYPNHPYYYYWAAKLLIDLYGSSQAKSIESHLATSAEMGYISAQLTLMKLYATNSILEEKPQKSFEYAQKAASQGCIEAVTFVGRCYLEGYGIKQSIHNAKFFLTMAAKHNDQKAIKLLKQL